MGLFKRWRAKRAAKKQLKAEQKTQQEEKVKPSDTIQPVEQTKPEEIKTPKAEPKKEQVEEKKVEDTTETKVEKERIAKYHVSQNKDKKSAYFKQWRVRKEGSKKTIKYHNTQKEAIEHAEDLAEKAGSSVVIHKLDGTIRKQNYND